MQKKLFFILGLCLVLTSLSFDAGVTQEAQQVDPKVMEAYMKIMAVNENHAFLKNFVGEWTVSTKAWMMPGAEPVVSQNAAKAELILGGRFLRVDFKGKMFGQPFEGLQIIGYDNQQKKYASFWIDSSSTAFYLTSGTRDVKTNVVVETGLWPDPMTGKDMKVRTVTTLKSKDENMFEMYMSDPEGKEFKSMENRSTRKK